jgi:hypothetical protein
MFCIGNVDVVCIFHIKHKIRAYPRISEATRTFFAKKMVKMQLGVTLDPPQRRNSTDPGQKYTAMPREIYDL